MKYMNRLKLKVVSIARKLIICNPIVVYRELNILKLVSSTTEQKMSAWCAIKGTPSITIIVSAPWKLQTVMFIQPLIEFWNVNNVRKIIIQWISRHVAYMQRIIESKGVSYTLGIAPWRRPSVRGADKVTICRKLLIGVLFKNSTMNVQSLVPL